MRRRQRLSADARRLLVAQGLRAFAYGFGALLLATTLRRHGFSSAKVGLVLSAVVAGTVVSSLTVARWSDQFGRRRTYVTLYVVLAAAGAAFALTANMVVLIVVALSGALSTDIVDNGPFTSLEQAMLATDLAVTERIRGFGLYNAVAAAAGSMGALAAGGPDLVRRHIPSLPADQRFFLLFVPVALAGAAVAGRLSPTVEAASPAAGSRRVRTALGRSKPTVVRLAALFATDAFGGGFVVQAFIAYWFEVRFHASVGVVGVMFLAIGILQTGSFLAATALAERFGLLSTMVFTHLPSNLLLGAIAFSPNLPVAIGLLLARSVLSQMDVPTRQAYVMALVEPDERTAAAGYTNTARYVVRPLGPVLAGVGQGVFLGLPFVIAATVKSGYDLVLWRWFRSVSLPADPGAARSDDHSPAGVSEDVRDDGLPSQPPL